ncbi:MAG: CHASE domain-containing protein [Elusimicrobiota bacterium]|jgi:PAS domain S-box-containing protein
MPEAPTSRLPAARPALFSYVITGLAALLTLSAMLYVRRVTLTSEQTRVSSYFLDTQQNIQPKLDGYLAALRAAAGFIQVNPKVTAAQVRRFTQQLDLEKRYPGLLSLGFVKYQKPAARNAQVGRRTRILPGNTLSSDPVRRTAMERARDTGAASASGRVSLPPEIDKNRSSGFFIYLPVYTAKAPTGTPEQRRRALIGFVSAAFRGDDLLHGIFRKDSEEHFDYALYDGDQAVDSKLLARSAEQPKGWFQRARFRSLQPLEIAGRSWTLELRSRVPFAFSTVWIGPLFVGLAGFLTSWLLFIALRMSERRAQASDQKSAELQQLNKNLEQRFQELETLFRVMPVGIGTTEGTEGELVSGNPYLAHLLGQEPDAPLTKSYRILRQEDEEFLADELPMPMAARTGEDVPGIECDVERADGSRRHLLCSATPLFNPDGTARGSLGVFTDITEQKQAREDLQHSRDELEKLVLKRLAELHKTNQALTAKVEELSKSAPDKTDVPKIIAHFDP